MPRTTGSADLFCRSAVLPPITTKSRGPQEQARYLADSHKPGVCASPDLRFELRSFIFIDIMATTPVSASAGADRVGGTNDVIRSLGL